MSTVVNNMVQCLTGKQSLQDVTVEELQSIADRHPYFMAAQLLLAVKMKDGDATSYNHQLQKAASLFPDPQLFYLQLQRIEEDVRQEDSVPESISPEKNVAVPVVENADALPQTSSPKEDGIIDTVSDGSKSEAMLANEAAQSETPAVLQEDTVDSLEELTASDVMPEAENESGSTDASPETPEEDMIPSRLSEMLQSHAEELKKEVDADGVLPLETPAPAFTKDYFKSQGIQLPENDNSELGKKVRKFTDWIRQTRRLHPTPVDLGGTPEEEKVILQKAADSIKKGDVWTEAMAEVLVKQGKVEEAIKVFEKLSLQIPEKSAYFAHQIEILKQN